MLKLTVVRHGSTELNEGRRYQGRLDRPLSHAGEAEAARLRKLLERSLTQDAAAGNVALPRVYTSDSLRSQQTAAIALPGVEPVLDPRLREFDFGAFDGLTWEDNLHRNGDAFQAWLDDPAGVRPPNGETLGEFRARVDAWLAELPRQGHVIAFTHGGTIQVILQQVLRIPFHAARHHAIEPGDALRLIVPAHATGPVPPPVRLSDRIGDHDLPKAAALVVAVGARPAGSVAGSDDAASRAARDVADRSDSRDRHPRAPRPKQRTPGPYRVPPRERRDGLVIVNTGNGKGKTTAALGVLLRAIGREMRVAMLQFIKSADVERGEHIGARRLGVEIVPLGAGFTWLSENIEEDRVLARKCWARCVQTMESGDYDVIIFDELTYALSYGWLEHAEVLGALRDRPRGTHVIITGRDATPELVEFADLVTEMREIKHPYRTRGLGAQPGIEL